MLYRGIVMKKYEITSESKVIDTIMISKKTVYRIKALKDFSDVKKGDLGGWIESERNLSHDGDCWIYDNAACFDSASITQNATMYDNSIAYHHAQVFGQATIKDDAVVRNNALVTNNATIKENAVIGDGFITGYVTVSGNSYVSNDTKISGYTIVEGNARLTGKAFVKGRVTITDPDMCVFDNVGSVGGTLTVYRTTKGIYVTRGCFQGTLSEFEKAVNDTHGTSVYGNQYRKLIEYIKLRYEQN